MLSGTWLRLGHDSGVETWDLKFKDYWTLEGHKAWVCPYALISGYIMVK